MTNSAVQGLQRAIRLPGEAPPTPEGRRGSGSDRSDRDRPGTGGEGSSERAAGRSREIWRRSAPKLEAWAGTAGARHDPVLTLHFNYGMLYASSPVYASSERVWGALSQTHEGYAQLERSRDAAFAVLQSLTSPEIARTLGYAFPVLRPFFGLAIVHLVSMATTLSHTPIISVPHVQSVLRNVVQVLGSAQPLDGVRDPASPPVRSPASAPPTGRPPEAAEAPRLPQSVLLEMAETGAIVQIGRRDIVAAEPGRDLWRRVLG